MNPIEQQAIEIFQKNLIYLQANHEAVYKKIMLLDTLINNQTYTEKYALEYKDPGYFDISEVSSQEYLYKENSLLHAQRMINTFDLKRTGAVFQGQKFSTLPDAQADLIDKSELSFHNALWAIAKLVNLTGKIATPDSYMQNVKKIIFLGVGLGLHLEGIIDKFSSQVIFIKEKNLETFRLSLFVTDYAKLAQGRFLYFSLTDDVMEERKNFIEFLDRGNNHNLYLKHIPFTLDYQPELQRLQSHVLSQSYINYGYSAMLLRFIDSPKYLTQGYSFCNVNKLYTDTFFSNKPVLLLFSGPSTSKNIDWVIANHNRFILVSALSTCKLLQRYGIAPDIVVHIDPSEETALLFEGLPIDYFKDTIAVLASNVNESTVERFKGRPIHFIEQGSNYKKGFGKLSAPTVGEYSYALMLIFGTINIFMLGIDLALDNETLQSHDDFHFGQIKGVHDQQNASLIPSSSVVYVKGNFLERVPTFESYKLSLVQIEIFTKMLKKEYHHTYNLSNGAYLEGCEPLHINEYDWNSLPNLDKNVVSDGLSTIFDSICSDDFSEEDQALIRYQIKEAKKLEKIIKKHQKKKFANAEAYLNSLTKLSWDLSDMEYKTHSDLAQVYYEYFSIILSYIFDMFNTQDLKNPDKHVTKIHTLLISQLLKISTLYIQKLESYFEKR